jgi:hypothetical protein
MEKSESVNSNQKMDRESEACLTQIVEQDSILANRVNGVKFVLVVLSSRGMVYDMEALRQKIVLSYPDVAVFFQTTDGKPIGPASPERIDLLIDFTGPGQRQGWFYSKKLRKMARVAVGRNAGLFRKKIYDRIFDEKAQQSIPQEVLEQERFVQKKVLNLAGVAFIQAGDTTPDRGKSIALELPPMRRL